MSSHFKLKPCLNVAICSWAFHNSKISQINFLLNRFPCCKSKPKSNILYIYIYFFLVIFLYTVLSWWKKTKIFCFRRYHCRRNLPVFFRKYLLGKILEQEDKRVTTVALNCGCSQAIIAPWLWGCWGRADSLLHLVGIKQAALIFLPNVCTTPFETQSNQMKRFGYIAI